MRKFNPILLSDSYKYSHWLQYPENTTYMHSYLESRGSSMSHTVFFGLQYYLKEYLSQPITFEDIDEAEEVIKAHGLPFNRKGWEHIVNAHGGKWPVIIKAVPEGSVIPTGNVLMTVESTDPEVFWVASFLETLLLKVWYPITVASQSYHLKKLIKNALEITCDNPEEQISFKLHDFGYRGVSSEESAGIGGLAHLVNFMGTDTIAALMYGKKYYGEPMAGFSIPASEHSTMTMWGKDNESRAYENMLDKYSESPIFACVSDSYDIFNACENIWGKELKAKVENRNGMLVIRPDSGDPVQTCRNVLQILDRSFGSTINGKGFKVLNKVRIIQGDGVCEDTIARILSSAMSFGYSAENFAFGMGGALLQKVDRDTMNFAFKCSSAEINGKPIDVFKDPVGQKMKKSKKGLLELSQNESGKVHTVRRGDAWIPMLVTVYENGEIYREYSLAEIRENTKKEYKEYVGWRHRDI